MQVGSQDIQDIVIGFHGNSMLNWEMFYAILDIQLWLFMVVFKLKFRYMFIYFSREDERENIGPRIYVFGTKKNVYFNIIDFLTYFLG